MRLRVAATIIALVVAVSFILSTPHTRDIPAAVSAVQSAPVSIPSVTLHDAFKKGVHTITGFIETPNACAIVTSEAALSGTATGTAAGAENILVAVSVSGDTGVCLQVPTKMNFSMTITAPAHLPITATVNSIAATTTLL